MEKNHWDLETCRKSQKTIFSLGGLDTTGMPFDSVEAWDVMTDEIIEFQDSPHFLPTDAADFTFIEIDDYKVRNI